MQQHSGLTVTQRLVLSFGLIVLFGISSAMLASVKMRSLSSDMQVISQERMSQVRRLVQFKDGLNGMALNVRNMMIDPTQERRDRWKSLLEGLQQSNLKLLDDISQHAPGAEAREAVNSIRALNATYDAVVASASAIASTGDAGAADKALFAGRETRLALFKAVEQAIQEQFDEAEALSRAGADSAKRTARDMFALALAMGVIGAWVAWRISAQLRIALGAEPAVLSASANAFSRGHLDIAFQLRTGDELSTLAALSRTQEALRSIVTTVRDNAESVATASVQIAQGNADLSQRTEKQASALQETAATMEELTSTVRNNADNARRADALANEASGVAARGGEVMGEVIRTIQGIQDGSKRIADIVGVIDGIAFQTNILALNAAVEAARAGEQGRGFAVVASEVRALALRSAEAAREIHGLIAGSVEQVEQGVGLVRRAGSTMEEVVTSIQRVTAIVGEISGASREQSAGVAQIGQVITQLDQVTQHNAALVEEGAAAAEALKDQAKQLVSAVAFFRLAER